MSEYFIMLCWRPWERFGWKKQNCAPWTDLFQTSYIGNRYKLHRQWILKNSDIILLDGNRFTFNEPELEWLSHYSVGFTTALHSINCLVVSPLWWSRKRLWGRCRAQQSSACPQHQVRSRRDSDSPAFFPCERSSGWWLHRSAAASARLLERQSCHISRQSGWGLVNIPFWPSTKGAHAMSLVPTYPWIFGSRAAG